MAFPTALSIALAIACLSLTLGSIFDDEHEPKEGDGSLRCYQCNSSEAEDPAKSPCHLDNWRQASAPTKRNMVMQCPRSRSSFCHLMLGLHKSETVRGCSGLHYENGKKAYIGCFFMGDEYRVCLCDSNLCNSASRFGSFSIIASLYFMGIFMMSCRFNLGLI